MGLVVENHQTHFRLLDLVYSKRFGRACCQNAFFMDDYVIFGMWRVLSQQSVGLDKKVFKYHQESHQFQQLSVPDFIY